jgi:hypothetical protein
MIESVTMGSVQRFDSPVRLPSRRATLIALTLGTWALFVVTVPLYLVFVLGNLADVFAIVASMRAAVIPGARESDPPIEPGLSQLPAVDD